MTFPVHLRLASLLLGLLWLHSAAAAELLIHKQKRLLQYRNGEVTREFQVSLGFTPIGPKMKQGDGKTPEGVYYIMNKNPKSRFHLSIGVSYPNIEDASKGLQAGLISRKQYSAIAKAIRHRRIPPQGTRLGGEIYIHGGGTQSDWTWGCIALSNEDITFLYRHIKVGDKVTIVK